MYRLAIAFVFLAVLLAGCASGPQSEWVVVEWGDGKDSLQGAGSIRVAPVVLDAPPAAADEVRPTNWQTAWPDAGAAKLAAGISDADGGLDGRTTGKADLGAVFTVVELYNGDGGGHYMGANPEAIMRGVLVVKDSQGRIVVKLNGTGRMVSYRGHGAFEQMHYELGESFTSWVEGQR